MFAVVFSGVGACVRGGRGRCRPVSGIERCVMVAASRVM